MNALKAWVQRYQLSSMLLLALLLAVVLPLSLDIFRLNLVGKYLTYAFVAIGLVMVWGYGGILSLGQGVFFGLGGYAMAMFLKLEASDPETTKIQSTPGIPDFMDWNQITELPLLWLPRRSLPPRPSRPARRSFSLRQWWSMRRSLTSRPPWLSRRPSSLRPSR